MNDTSLDSIAMQDAADTRPILIVPYMWIGDFVRGHSVIRVLKKRWPNRPIDILVSKLVAPLVDYMPGVRAGIVWDLPRGKIRLSDQTGLAAEFRKRGYGSALIMPRTWKSAIAPALAGIPERTGFVGEVRFGLLNDWRWGEKALPRMIDRKGALALPKGAPPPAEWPVPQLRVAPDEVLRWRQTNGLGDGKAVALGPGSVGPAKRWSYYPEAARQLTDQGHDIWVIGGPGEKTLAAEIVAAAGPKARDLTSNNLRNGVIAMAAAEIAIANDSGLMHIAAALDTPTMGIFGPTSPSHWAPLNPLAATVLTKTIVPCQPCHKPVCTINDHACMRDIPAADVVAIADRIMADADQDRLRQPQPLARTNPTGAAVTDAIAAHLTASRNALVRAAEDVALRDVAQTIAETLVGALRSGNKILLIGNGGSAADAQHIAAEIVGRYKKERAGWAAIALTTDTSALTSIANDYGFEQVFARQIEALGQKGDVLIALSTSGRSPNILNALTLARSRGLVTIGCTGLNGESMRAACDHLLVSPSNDTPVVQQIHMVMLHGICDAVERTLTA